MESVDRYDMDKLRLSRQFLLIIAAFCTSEIAGSRILGIFPIFSRSHFATHQVLMKTLASRGHQVTVLTFFNETLSTSSNYNNEDSINIKNNGTYAHICLGDLGDVESYVDSITPEEAQRISGFHLQSKLAGFPNLEKSMCSAVFSHDYIQNILNGKILPPDLLIVESFNVPCYCSLAEKYDIPVVSSLAPAYMPGADYSIGNPIHPAYWPSISSRYTQTMSFHQRVVNFVHYVINYAIHYAWTVRTAYAIDERFVGNKDVTIEKLYGRVSLVILNNHFSFMNRPTVTNAIEVGGMHIKEAKPLPSETLKFIEGAKDGVIYFSLGTTLKMSALPKEKADIFMKVFSQIPQRILWRSDMDNLTNVPPNVMIRSWFNQRDILEHKNVKAFISHGGIFSSYEAVHTATPIVGIPFLYDQFVNVNILREKGVAIYLDYDDLDYESLLDALKRIINDHRYRDNMRKLSSIFRDRPMPPLDIAIYWVEYVIKHNGAPHLRNPAADMPFYKFLLLDVIGFILASLLVGVWMTRYFIKRIFNDGSRSVIIAKKIR